MRRCHKTAIRRTKARSGTDCARPRTTSSASVSWECGNVQRIVNHIASGARQVRQQVWNIAPCCSRGLSRVLPQICTTHSARPATSFYQKCHALRYFVTRRALLSLCAGAAVEKFAQVPKLEKWKMGAAWWESEINCFAAGHLTRELFTVCSKHVLRRKHTLQRVQSLIFQGHFGTNVTFPINKKIFLCNKCEKIVFYSLRVLVLGDQNLRLHILPAFAF